VRRLTLLIAGAAIWLVLAAAPVFADGGPHVLTVNDGSGGITADSCAGCHRAHTAQAPLLLVDEEHALCLTCHGSNGIGATTDVEDGVQYRIGEGSNVRGEVVLGALRNGGFEEARIDSSNTARLSYFRTATAISQRAKVPVLAEGEAVTSTHLTGPGVAWGNGAAGSGVGKSMELGCTSCHNPHGNGQHRILRPVPTNAGTIATATPITVIDAPLPAAGDTRNYTVIQKLGTAGDDATFLLYASQVVAGGYAATDGDYFHRTVPWNPPDCDPTVNAGSQGAACTTMMDAPNGLAATFNTQISTWCTQCHTRYYASTNPNPGGLPGPTGAENPATAQAWWFPRPGEDIYKYQHQTTTNRACTTCHVSHGSNAVMDGAYSGDFPYPHAEGATAITSASSRLLKIDNRGTCQACHDPTETTTGGTYYGPNPMPGSP
jgi:predicted CXXCH cytochrome family protein